MSARTTSDAAKCILIFWCLLGFIGLGLEHCVANMTLLSANLMLNGVTSSGLSGMASNLMWVTPGNTFAGAVCMGVGYWVASGLHKRDGVLPEARAELMRV
jgi:nitrite transporter NirC